MKYALALSALLVACHHDEAPKPVETAQVAAEADSKQMALAPTHENAAVDHVIAAAQSAAKKNPQKVDLWISLGRAWVRKARETEDPGYYLHADACADVALAIAPEDTSALGLRALVLLNQHRFAEAEALARTITTKRADDPVAWGNLSDVLLEMGRTEEAAKAAQTMVDLKPNLPSYARAAHFRWLAGDAAGAKSFYHHAIDAGADQRDPEPRAWVLVQTANVFWNEGDANTSATRSVRGPNLSICMAPLSQTGWRHFLRIDGRPGPPTGRRPGEVVPAWDIGALVLTFRPEPTESRNDENALVARPARRLGRADGDGPARPRPAGQQGCVHRRCAATDDAR